MKGAMRAEDGSVWYLQSVQRLFDVFPAQGEEQRKVEGTKVVVLGRRLDQARLQADFDRILCGEGT